MPLMVRWLATAALGLALGGMLGGCELIVDFERDPDDAGTAGSGGLAPLDGGTSGTGGMGSEPDASEPDAGPLDGGAGTPGDAGPGMDAAQPLPDASS